MKASIEFEMGEKTCAIETDKCCRWFGVTRFGTQAVCMLFDNEILEYSKADGWQLRCKRCLELFPPPNGDAA